MNIGADRWTHRALCIDDGRKKSVSMREVALVFDNGCDRLTGQISLPDKGLT